MKEILIDGDIGYDWWSDSGVTLKSVKAQLAGLEAGEKISVVINSPGGSAYEVFTIYNYIRDMAKTHEVSVNINCLAASIAAYIALAARSVDRNAKITVSDNSVFMIHNPWECVIGDYRTLKTRGEYYEKLAVVFAAACAAASGKPESEIRAAMDAETFYVGKEIADFGFATDYENISDTQAPDSGDTDLYARWRDARIVNTTIACKKTQENEYQAVIENKDAYMGDMEKVAALLKTDISVMSARRGAARGTENITEEGVNMETPEELLAKNKALYDAVFALGEKTGVEKERARAGAHLLLGEKAKALSIAAKHIKSGALIGDDAVQAEYMAANMDANRINARVLDNPGDAPTGGEDGGGVDDAKLLAAFDKGASGKDVEGKAWTE